MKRIVTILFLSIFCTHLYAQEMKVSGTVTSGTDKSPLPGVSIYLKDDPDKGVITDVDGKYSLMAPGQSTLIFSFIGYDFKEVEVGSQSVIDVVLDESRKVLNELVITGTRSVGRTELETAVPIDVISIEEMMGDMPQMDLAQMLAVLAPSFSAFKSQGGDLNSHVDPAQLRNLAPNQTLVLINGKRRHTSALLIISTAAGSPSTTVDMMAIPASAIERVEILRDGAAAQYGSDAIAGVINIVLKKGTGELTGSFTAGGYMNSGGDADELTLEEGPDGYNYQLTANYGFNIGRKGFINLSGELTQRNPTIRPFVNDWLVYDPTYLNNERTDKYGNPVITNPELISALTSGDEGLATTLRTSEGLMAARGLEPADFAVYAGTPAVTLGSMFYNSEFEITQDVEFYSFGGFSYKFLEGYSCYYRRPSQTDRFNYLLYPNGFRPQMNSNTSDIATTMGIRGKAGIFNVDFSNTFGRNKMRIGMINTFNASIGANSPIDMNLGTHSFTQNTTNLDFSKFFPDVAAGFNIAFGAEMRVENYKIMKGQEESYAYGNAGVLTVVRDGLLVGPDGKPLENGASQPIVDENGNPLPVLRGDEVTVKSLAANCQCFAGFGPKNERDIYRTNLAAYVDAELDVTDKLLVTGAARIENYSDFGDVITGKVAARYTVLENLALRGSYSTGFRAPSLQELNYTHTATVFLPDENGVPQPVDFTTYPTNSTAARVLGIKELSEEKSENVSVGLTYQLARKLELSIDAFQIDVKDRIFRTDNFNAADVGNNYDEVIGAQGEAQFFVNGGDVRSRGLEIVGNYATKINRSELIFNVATILSKNELKNIKVVDLNVENLTESELIEKYINRDVIGQFETGTPRTKLIGSVNYKIGKFSSMLRGTYYGEVTELSVSSSSDGEYYDQTFSSQIVFDLSLGYALTPDIKLSVGGNNIFDAYPDILREENRGFYLYSNYQQGSNGAYYYGRITFNF